MWFIYAFSAMLLLVSRRSAEKLLSGKISSSALAWLQQATALPFMALMLPFADWFNPLSLSSRFQILLLLYALVTAVDLLVYYKALQIGDISIIAPLLNLSAVTGIVASFIFLDQKPNIFGILGALLIFLGAFFITKHRNKQSATASNNALAILLVIGITILRGVYSPIEVTLLREVNPIFLNFISSVLTVPIIIFIIAMQNKKSTEDHFSKKLFRDIAQHKIALGFIGFTMAMNIFFTLTAKTTAPNAGYVTAIKGAQVVPMTFLGVLLFKEHVTKRQWVGVWLIALGLVVFLFS
jgi:transporter family protein